MEKMTDEEFALKQNVVCEINNKTYLKEGDIVDIVSSEGNILKRSVVESIFKNYAIIDEERYWCRGVNKKHRRQNRYTVFAMKPEDASVYCFNPNALKKTMGIEYKDASFNKFKNKRR